MWITWIEIVIFFTVILLVLIWYFIYSNDNKEISDNDISNNITKTGTSIPWSYKQYLEKVYWLNYFSENIWIFTELEKKYKIYDNLAIDCIKYYITENNTSYENNWEVLYSNISDFQLHCDTQFLIFDNDKSYKRLFMNKSLWMVWKQISNIIDFYNPNSKYNWPFDLIVNKKDKLTESQIKELVDDLKKEKAIEKVNFMYFQINQPTEYNSSIFNDIWDYRSDRISNIRSQFSPDINNEINNMKINIIYQ